jgi:transposase-like protein
MKKQCTNFDCKSTIFIKDGHFQRKNDSRLIQRFRCKKCGTRFSNASFALEKNQKKRTINHLVRNLFCEGMSMSGIARSIGINPKTVDRKLEYLQLKAHIENAKTLKDMTDKVEYIQFDDMETHEHTKMKPITCTVVTDVDSRKILALKAGRIPAKGHLAKLSRQKYGRRKSEHKAVLEHTFKNLAPILENCQRVDSDKHAFYPEFVATYIPNAIHYRFKSRKACITGQGEMKKGGKDPLFWVNHIAAMMRDHIKRFARRTWCNNKKLEKLQAHLDLYMWYHNEVYLAGG